MGVERRGRVIRGCVRSINREVFREESRGRAEVVRQAVRYLEAGGVGGVREGQGEQGRAGVDGVSIEDFEKDLKNNLYKIWNRMSSGTYFPPPVRAVEIPKPHGGGHENSRGAYRRGPDRADGGGPEAGGEGRADLPPGLLRLPAGAVGAGRGGGMPAALLEDRLGDRFGHPEVLRQRPWDLVVKAVEANTDSRGWCCM